MPVLSKAEEEGRMQPEEYFTYFEDCIFPSDIKECEAFALNKGFGQKRAFIDTLLGLGRAKTTRRNTNYERGTPPGYGFPASLINRLRSRS